MISYILYFPILLFALNSYVTYGDQSSKILVTPYGISYFDFFTKFKVVGQGKFYQSKSYFASRDGKVNFSLPTAGKVVKGQVILEIDKDTAIANKDRSEWSYKNAQVIYTRNQQLFKKSIISSEALDASELKVRSALLDLNKAKSDYENSIIIAPFDGEVGVIKAKDGYNVHQGDFLFNLINAKRMIVHFELPEILYGKVLPHAQIMLTDNKGNQSPGEVISVSPYLSDEGTFTVEIITIENNDFIHNSYLVGEFRIDQHQGLAVPEQAILRDNTENFVYLINNEKIVQKKLVKIGFRTNNMVEIISQEIADGSLVVLEGLTKVSDNTKIELSN